MSKAQQCLFPFSPLGEISVTINNVAHAIQVDFCDHGARFITRFKAYLEVGEGETTPIINRTVRFGEGLWLSLPTIEQAVLEELGGSYEDVEEVSKQYDQLLQFNMPQYLANPNSFVGFIKGEYERLKDGESAV